MCLKCFDVGPQTLGVCRSCIGEFDRYKILKQTSSRRADSNTPTVESHETDVQQECNRLVEGFKKSIGTSKIRSFMVDFMSPVKVPEWQKSKNWKVSTQRV